MRALFGVVSLLVVLALVAMIGVRHMRAVGRVGSAPAVGAAAPQMPGSGTERQQAVDLQNKVVGDVAKAMNDADTRRQEAEKP